MNVSQLLAEMYRRTGYQTTPDAAITTRFTSFLAITQRQILTKPGMEKLRDDTIPFASVVNQAVYALPPSVAKIEHIQDRVNNRAISEKPLTWLRTVDPGLTSVGGPPIVYIPRGYQQVAQQPAAASGLWAVSSTTDITAKVFVEAILTGGYRHIPASAGTTLNSTTRVALGARTDMIEVVKFYLDVAAAGFVSLYDAASGGNELARIEPGKLYSRYLAIQLWPTPGSVITYHVDNTRVILDFVNPTDEPLLPEDFHWVLVEGALVKEWSKKDDSRRADAKRDYDDGVNSLRSWITSNQDTVASLRRVPVAFSQLGPTYPAGS